MNDLREKGTTLMQNRQFNEALKIFQELVSKTPDDWSLLYMAGQCSRFTDDIPEAISFLSKAAELNSSHSEVFHALGIALQLDGKHEKAIEALNRAVEINPESATAHNSLGLTYKIMDNPKMAIQCYSKAAEMHVNSIHKILMESDQCFEVKELESGEKTMLLKPYFLERVHELLKSNPTYSFIKNNMGACFLLLGDKVSAQEAFQDSIDCIPEGMDYPPPYDGLSNC